MPATSVEHEADSRPQSKATGAAGAAAPLVSATPLVSGLYTLHLVGNIRDARFHQALACANVLADRFRKNVVVRATTLTPLEWALYVDHVKPANTTFGTALYTAYTHAKLPRKLEAHDSPADVQVTRRAIAVTRPEHGKLPDVNDVLHTIIPAGAQALGGTAELLSFAAQTLGHSNVSSEEQTLATSEWAAWMKASKNSFATLGVSVDGVAVGELTLELFDNVCPKTCNHFKKLVEGTLENGKGEKLGYAGTTVNRLVKNGWIQGGDTSSAGKNVTIEDESFAVAHQHRGIVSFANSGPHSNGSQFVIALRAMPAFDKSLVAFGRIVDGESVLRAIESVETAYPERPCKVISFGPCAVVKV